jgi:hypothetical protein
MMWHQYKGKHPPRINTMRGKSLLDERGQTIQCSGWGTGCTTSKYAFDSQKRKGSCFLHRPDWPCNLSRPVQCVPNYILRIHVAEREAEHSTFRVKG